jgi:hypothetical protein
MQKSQIYFCSQKILVRGEASENWADVCVIDFLSPHQFLLNLWHLHQHLWVFWSFKWSFRICSWKVAQKHKIFLLKTSSYCQVVADCGSKESHIHSRPLRRPTFSCLRPWKCVQPSRQQPADLWLSPVEVKVVTVHIKGIKPQLIDALRESSCSQLKHSEKQSTVLRQTDVVDKVIFISS